MEFVLTFQQPQEIYEANADPVTGPAALEPWMLYMRALSEAGVMRGGNRLDVLHATRVRVRDGRRLVQDGPFADTKELLGGYVLIDVPSLDEALTWAERAPSAGRGSCDVYALKAPGSL